MDRPNLFMEDTDFNICLSWICDSTEGQTYSISDHFAKKMKRPENMSEDDWYDKIMDFFNWTVWEEAVGWKHDYRVDDPAAHEVAERMVKELNALIERLNEDPDYLRWDSEGNWVLELKKYQLTQPIFKYSGMKREACKVCAERIAAETKIALVKQNMELVADRLLTCGWFQCDEFFFNFREETKEV